MPWQSKETFFDPVATDLIFHQIIKFVRLGQYKCSKVTDQNCVKSNILMPYLILNNLKVHSTFHKQT